MISMLSHSKYKGLKDVLNGLQGISLPIYLARADIRQRYRRSSLGPFWITISTAVMIACIGLIFGRLFKSPMEEFLPFLAAGLIVWGQISSTLSESTVVFSNSEAVIKQLPLPLFVHVMRMVFRNFYIFLHNILVYPIVLLCVGKPLNIFVFLFLPGILLLLINLLWMALLIGIVCARFRDLSQIVNSFLQIVFYVTPIIWMPKLLSSRSEVFVLGPNPFYHLIEIVRAPLLGACPSLVNYVFSVVLALFGWSFTLFVFNKFRGRIAYWL